MAMSYIAGDIGGTNARIALYKIPEKEGDEIQFAKKSYLSNDFAGLTAVIRKFMYDHEIEVPPNVACFSIAGPVKGGAVNMINLGWNITEKEVEEEIGIEKVVFLNDFAACGYGVNLLGDDDIVEITNNLKCNENGTKSIIGAGTGLGEANMLCHKGDFIVVPGEGGHTDFSPRNKVEFDLMMFIKNTLKLSRVGVERVVSGPGLHNIYNFMAHENKEIESSAVTNKINASETPGKIISEHAISKKDQLCEKALKLFISCYGAEAGNMALNILPSGGVYVAGGIAPQILGVMKEIFMENFVDKGRMRSMLMQVPVYVVTNLSLGILGARFIARINIFQSHPSITRIMSESDIRKNSIHATVISKDDPHARSSSSSPLPPIAPRAVKRRNRLRKINDDEEHRSQPYTQPSRRTISNVFWMGTGFALSIVLIGVFYAGRRSRD